MIRESIVAVGVIALAVAGFVGMMAFGTGVAMLMTLEYAWVATKLWGWFVVTAFGLPILSVWQMFGLFLFVKTFKFPKPVEEAEADWQTGIKRMVLMALAPLFILLMGYIIQAYCLKG